MITEQAPVTAKQEPVTTKIVAWALVNSLVSNIFLCLVTAVLAAFFWNALSPTTGLPDVGLREAFCAVALLRLAVFIHRL